MPIREILEKKNHLGQRWNNIYIYIERERERERNQRVKFVLLKDSIGFLYQPLIIVDNHA